MNLTAKRENTLNISMLYITTTFPWDDFEKWCEIHAEVVSDRDYFEYDSHGEDPNMLTTREFLFDKYLEENDIDSLAKEYLTEKLEQ